MMPVQTPPWVSEAAPTHWIVPGIATYPLAPLSPGTRPGETSLWPPVAVSHSTRPAMTWVKLDQPPT